MTTEAALTDDVVGPSWAVGGGIGDLPPMIVGRLLIWRVLSGF